MPYKRGAPNGNRHALKSGRFTRESLARRKRVQQTLRSARVAMRDAKLELALAFSAPGQATRMDKSM